MYISEEEMTTHLYGEQAEIIADGDLRDLLTAINVGIAEVRGYLTGRYDIDTELAKSGAERNSLVMLWVKDIAVWHFVNKVNVNTSLELRAKRRDDAIEQLKSIQKGNFDIALAPKVDQSGEPANTTPFAMGSNRRRESHI